MQKMVIPKRSVDRVIMISQMDLCSTLLLQKMEKHQKIIGFKLSREQVAIICMLIALQIHKLKL